MTALFSATRAALQAQIDDALNGLAQDINHASADRAIDRLTKARAALREIDAFEAAATTSRASDGRFASGDLRRAITNAKLSQEVGRVAR